MYIKHLLAKTISSNMLEEVQKKNNLNPSACIRIYKSGPKFVDKEKLLSG